MLARWRWPVQRGGAVAGGVRRGGSSVRGAEIVDNDGRTRGEAAGSGSVRGAVVAA